MNASRDVRDQLVDDAFGGNSVAAEWLRKFLAQHFERGSRRYRSGVEVVQVVERVRQRAFERAIKHRMVGHADSPQRGPDGLDVGGKAQAALHVAKCSAPGSAVVRDRPQRSSATGLSGRPRSASA